jgi:predicted N-formylglutamate amidohydrolase
MRSHAAWDKGSREIAAIVADGLGAAHFAGRYSRLLVDLNRSRGNKNLIPKERFGYKIPGNRKLTRKARDERLEKYYTPYREVVEAAIRRALQEEGSCLHLSIHTFAPTLQGESRNADVGLLYDPKRRKERVFAERLRDALLEVDVETRMNYPYPGTGDGFTTSLRKELPKTKYIGIEIEVNQRALRTSRSVWRMGRLMTEALADAIDI